jgi:hypothetical protein
MSTISSEIESKLGDEQTKDLEQQLREEWQRLLTELRERIDEDLAARSCTQVLRELGAFESRTIDMAAANGIPIRASLNLDPDEGTKDNPLEPKLRCYHARIVSNELFDLPADRRTIEIASALGHKLDTSLFSEIASSIEENGGENEWRDFVESGWSKDITRLFTNHGFEDIPIEENVETWDQPSLTEFFDRQRPHHHLLPSALVLGRLEIAWKIDASLFCDLIERLPSPNLAFFAIDEFGDSFADLQRIIEAAEPGHEEGEWQGRITGIGAMKQATDHVERQLKQGENETSVLEEWSSVFDVLLERDIRGAAELVAQLKRETLHKAKKAEESSKSPLEEIYLHALECLDTAALKPSEILSLPRSGAHIPISRYLSQDETGRIGGRDTDRNVAHLPHILLAIDFLVDDCENNENSNAGNDSLNAEDSDEVLEALIEASVARDPGFRLLGTTHADVLSVPRRYFSHPALLLARKADPAAYIDEIWERLADQHHRFKYGTTGDTDFGVLIPSVWWVCTGLECCVFLVGDERYSEAETLWEELYRYTRQLWLSEPSTNPFDIKDFVARCFAYLPHVLENEPNERALEYLELIATTPHLLGDALLYLHKNGFEEEDVRECVENLEVSADPVTSYFERVGDQSHEYTDMADILKS